MAKGSNSSIVKRAKAQLARSRLREKQAVHTAIGKGSGIVTAAGVGAFEDKLPITIFKVPTKLIGAAVLYGISAFTKGGMSKAAESAADALADVYAYKVAMQTRIKQEKPLVAGDDDETGYIEEM
jgi:hypothetical protein